MSTKRRAGARFLGKGPGGRNLCFCGCGREVEKPRINWFSDACVAAWQLINDPATIRRRVSERDHGICAACGVDTERRAKEAADWLLVLQWLARRHFDGLMDRGELDLFRGHTPSQRRYYDYRVGQQERVTRYDAHLHAEAWAAEEVARRFGSVRAHDGHAWEADHIIPVIEGGGQCGLENYRTLCLPCHRKATAELARRRAEARKRAKDQASGVLVLDLNKAA